MPRQEIPERKSLIKNGLQKSAVTLSPKYCRNLQDRQRRTAILSKFLDFLARLMAPGNTESAVGQICTERRKENREPTKEAQSINRSINQSRHH
jgi:hypothetical protein